MRRAAAKPVAEEDERGVEFWTEFAGTGERREVPRVERVFVEDREGNGEPGRYFVAVEARTEMLDFALVMTGSSSLAVDGGRAAAEWLCCRWVSGIGEGVGGDGRGIWRRAARGVFLFLRFVGFRSAGGAR